MDTATQQVADTPQVAVGAQPEWIERREAADRLKVSERTVLLYAQSGKITTKKERNASNQIATMFHAGDVERMAYSRDNPEAAQAAQPTTLQALRGGELATQPEKVHALQALQPLGVWMTVDEAVEHSHLSRSWLTAAAQAGTVTVRDMGKGARGGRWRFYRRAD
jgi:hypothetical protein